MFFEYTEAQDKVLKQRVAFLKSFIRSLVITNAFFWLFLAGGITLIVLGKAFIGVVLTLISIIPCFIAGGCLYMALSLNRCIQKSKYKIYSAQSQTAKHLDPDKHWQEVVVTEGVTTYYYTDYPGDALPLNTEIHIVACDFRPRFALAVDPIYEEDIPEVTVDIEE